jgi:hypothetical protein
MAAISTIIWLGILRAVSPPQVLLLYSWNENHQFAKALSKGGAGLGIKVISLFPTPPKDLKEALKQNSLKSYWIVWKYLRATSDRLAYGIGTKYRIGFRYWIDVLLELFFGIKLKGSSYSKNWIEYVRKYLEIVDAIVVDLSDAKDSLIDEIILIAEYPNSKLLEKAIFVFRDVILKDEAQNPITIKEDASGLYTRFENLTANWYDLARLIEKRFPGGYSQDKLDDLKSAMPMPVLCFPYALIVISNNQESINISSMGEGIWKGAIGATIRHRIKLKMPILLLILPHLIVLILLFYFIFT